MKGPLYRFNEFVDPPPPNSPITIARFVVAQQVRELKLNSAFFRNVHPYMNSLGQSLKGVFCFLRRPSSLNHQIRYSKSAVLFLAALKI